MAAALRSARWPVLAALAIVAAPFPLVRAATAAEPLTRDLAVELVLDVLVVWSFLGSGLALWYRQPGNRVGALMMGFGCARSFGWLLAQSDAPWIYTLGLLVQDADIVQRTGHRCVR